MKSAALGLDEFLAAVALAARARRLPPLVRRRVRGGGGERGVRADRRLGARALPLPGPAPRSTRWSTCPFALPTAVAGITLTALLAKNGWIGALARAARHRGRLHAARRRGGARLHRPAVRRAHRAAGAPGPRARARGGGREPRREPLADVPRACCSRSSGPRSPPASRSRSRAAVGEYGSVVFISGNMPMKHRDRAAPDRHPARAVRLRRRDRDRRGAARDLVRAAARDQRAPALGRAALSARRERRDVRGDRLGADWTLPHGPRRRPRRRAPHATRAGCARC